ncbi:S-type pyocin domain-containing protein [Pseudomonas sp. PDM03]|uniref:S-type pyocin domain-containing protein n=1 Tax=Pseudomonas sp. PDM03 TaxID=2769266 RepID=UPI00177CD311|nr:S-type pyocin domain-containing protein [Pseudomonas sp. PDM03]MBD9588065.1 S-type pyocin domain-containing protein [Pseudomonas sp. PDM03]
MAQRFNDGTSGDVVIRSGPPASGGGGGGGGGGSFGGNRVGASGNFGGPSSKTIALRKAANREREAKAAQDRADAAARVQEQARLQSRQQLLTALTQRHGTFRTELDRSFNARAEQLTQSLEHEITAAKRHHAGMSSERWQLYLITKDKSEIDGLISRKTTELNGKNAIAAAFDGHDPLTRTAADYLIRLDQFGDALMAGHQLWESAYNAAHEARLLQAQIDALNPKSSALATHHAEQSTVWREREALWERQRQHAEQRGARVRFKQQVDEDARLERVRQANTFDLPVTSSALSAGILPSHGGEWVDAQNLVSAVTRAATIVGGVLSTVTRPQAAIFMAGVFYPTRELGNGELTPEQRHRLFEVVAVPAHALELHDSQELQAAADAGGSVAVEYRLKPVATPQGLAIVVAGTGGDIDSRVLVVNAVLNPQTGVYTAEIPGSPARQVQFAPDATPQAALASETRLTVTEPQIQDIPTGVDWRIQDCIVCVPGLPPTYLSFNVPAMGSGIVTGTGQPPTADWWKSTSQTAGAAIPSQIGDQFRGREFKSFEAFDEALWRTLGEHSALTHPLDEVNKKRIEQGFAPYAPKSTWTGESREFELRFQERPEFWSDPFNLDKISIKTPQSAEGWLGIVPAVVPWPVPPVGTWTPLVPPGSEHLGSTTSPIAPVVPVVYPGSPAIPVLPQNETFPAVDEGEIGASIPGYPGDMELPSPDALFRDRRDDPGIATGWGSDVSEVWLGDDARGDGAPVPWEIAEQLRWKEFRNFHGFRRAFWKAVAADPELRTQFEPFDLNLMKRGKAPVALLPDRNGGRIKFEIHHIVEVAQGGAVYEMDNLVVMTPVRHIKLHGKRN